MLHLGLETTVVNNINYKIKCTNSENPRLSNPLKPVAKKSRKSGFLRNKEGAYFLKSNEPVECGKVMMPQGVPGLAMSCSIFPL